MSLVQVCCLEVLMLLKPVFKAIIKFNKKGRVFYESMYLSWPFSS